MRERDGVLVAELHAELAGEALDLVGVDDERRCGDQVGVVLGPSHHLEHAAAGADRQDRQVRGVGEEGEQAGVEFVRDARAELEGEQQRALERRDVGGDGLVGLAASGVPIAAASAPRIASQDSRSSRGSAGSSAQTMPRAAVSAARAAATTARTGTRGRSGTIVRRVSRSGAANAVAAIGPRAAGMPWCCVFGIRVLLWGTTDQGAQSCPMSVRRDHRLRGSGAYDFSH